MSGQAFGKPPVTALQEYCAKKNLTLPTYEWIDSDDGSFICKVEAASTEAHGCGRSKREAKHDAAANIIKKIRLTHPDISEIPQAPHEATPTTDMIIQLRDYCVQHDNPLPIFELVQQTGPAEAPEFTVLCTLSTIKRYGRANNKKDARQKAALEMFRVILEGSDKNSLEHHMQIATLESNSEDLEAERYRKFKTYRELTDSKTGETPGILLCDRHYYFTKFFDSLKTEAKKIINTEFDSRKTQALNVLTALNITPKISKMAAINTFERFYLIELNCDYDVVFAGPESQIYNEIVLFFNDMLQ